jgi:hypothetical protein
MIFFLSQHEFQMIWVLYLGNGLFLFSVFLLIYVLNRRDYFGASKVSSAIAGHLISLAGAALSVLISVLLYVLFVTDWFQGHHSEALLNAAPAMGPNRSADLLAVILMNSSICNTISGFFAATLTSFIANRHQDPDVS